MYFRAQPVSYAESNVHIILHWDTRRNSRHKHLCTIHEMRPTEYSLNTNLYSHRTLLKSFLFRNRKTVAWSSS